MSPPSFLPHDWFPEPLPRNVELAADSWLYSTFAFVHFRSRRSSAVSLGRSSGVYNGTLFDLGPDGEVTIGKYSTLVGAIIATNGRVRIGDYCFIAHEVVIGDSPFARPAQATQSDSGPDGDIAVSVEIGDDVWIGGGAILLKGARIGDGSIVGTGAVVDFEVPPRSIVAGNPARLVGRV